MQKGDFVETLIEDMSNEGNGIGHAEEGMTVFAEGAIVGDTVRVGISKVKKNYAVGKTVKVLSESEFREEAQYICPYVDKCGGCGYGKLRYEKQLELKEKSVRDKLVRLAGLENPVVRPIIGMEEPWRYRNNATVSVYNDVVGFKEKKSNLVVDCEDCFIQDEFAVGCANALRKFIKEKKLKGVFTKLVVRVTSVGEVMTDVYTAKGKGLDSELSEELAYALDDGCEECLESIYIDGKLILGKATIVEEVGELKFEISPLSFFQVNSTQMVKLYDKVAEYARLKAGDTLLDLYCGVGTIGLYLLAGSSERREALKDARVIGIESVKPAVIDANRNAVINYIVNARYFTGKAEDELPFMMGMKKLYKPNEVNEMVERTPEVTLEHADCAVLDPPRAGCDKDLLDAVIKAAPDRIVYVSCDPGTLARDIKYITENSDYRFIEATPCDMFPGTVHCEVVAKLEKRT